MAYFLEVRESYEKGKRHAKTLNVTKRELVLAKSFAHLNKDHPPTRAYWLGVLREGRENA